MKLADEIYEGKLNMPISKEHVTLDEVMIGEETFFKLSHVNQMRPFFMSIVSHSDHWLFVSSNGGVTAGRKNSNYALFPYYTDDKITASAEFTGSKTILKVTKDGQTFLWEPFSIRQQGVYKKVQHLYKNTIGNKIIFEEINEDLGLKFSYEWNSSDVYGFIRKSKLDNLSDQVKAIEIVDGLQDILPWGVAEGQQSGTSNLVDAYKKCELEADSALGIYALSAVIVDKAEPSEALKANIVWSLGFENPTYLLSSQQLDAFRSGQKLHTEAAIKGEKGAYFLNGTFSLAAMESKNWMLIANVNQTVSDIVHLQKAIASDSRLNEKIQTDVDAGSAALIGLVAAADGLQLSADKRRNTRHFANTMFNIMRGGIFDYNYQIEKSDFLPYLERANKAVFAQHLALLEQLPNIFNLHDLSQLIEGQQDMNLKRLCLEYLPVKFSRRHGDPSRPWNKFSINTKNENDGSKILDYQGNWRDIFQNWEALAHAYPEFIEGMIHKFLNASTFEGYNPYRVVKDGFDWETIEPDNPWSYIGYWGDHQIIYLLKFLEFIEAYQPEKLKPYFDQDLFVYANVPYKIKSYAEILEDPKNTIAFDFEADTKIRALRDEMGTDGALLKSHKNKIYKVNFIEKILATVLAKISNFIPEGGIWMNTQRPEWNDANNALVGNGVSMVTLYYLRRFLQHFEKLLEKGAISEVPVSEALYHFFERVHAVLEQNKNQLSGVITDTTRKTILDRLGEAAESYRTTIYKDAFSGVKQPISIETVKRFTVTAQTYMEHSINANKRNDGLYHAYNLMSVKGDEIIISHLPEMLEGQVAVLSSGYLSTEASLNVLDGLRKSPLYRKDQNSYILYPNKDLPRFLDKNNIKPERVQQSDLIKELVAQGNTQIISKDVQGGYHFNGNFHNAKDLDRELKVLPATFQKHVVKDTGLMHEIFEEVFNHKAFTGRSGTFFGYEGLGSIYWHMVSKLLLATYEIVEKAMEEGADQTTIERLRSHYFEINDGIGAHKSPDVYGAFPTDPYSHTPGGKGAQQPGMTGQVKEDILSRYGELGITVQKGILSFHPVLLNATEFLNEQEHFEYFNILGQKHTIDLEPGTLAFTCCQVPIIYKKASAFRINVVFENGTTQAFEGNALDYQTSQSIFKRDGKINKLYVEIVK